MAASPISSLPRLLSGFPRQHRRRTTRNLLSLRAAAGDDVAASMDQMLAQSRRPSPAAGAATKVVVHGAYADPLTREAVRTLVAARGVEIAGAVAANSDPSSKGQDLGLVVGLPDPLEIPVLSDPVMLFASIAQARSAPGLYLDLTRDADSAFENVRQAVAFGLASVVGHCDFSPKQLNSLLDFCDKASTGCLVAPTLSLGTILLQQAALSLAFHYGHVDVVETLPPSTGGGGAPEGPSGNALDLAQSLSEIGRTFNGGDVSMQEPSRGRVVGEGVRIHSLRQPGLLSSLDVRFAAPGQTFSLRFDTTDARAFMPGLLLAVRRAPRLKGLVYGLEKVL